MERVLTIGRLAQTTGVPAKTIRYYEAVGVLPAAGRSRSGYRLYTERGVARLLFVRRARALGLSLPQLQTLTAALDGRGPAVRPQLMKLVRAQLTAVQHRQTELQLLEAELGRLLRRLRAPGRKAHSTSCTCLEGARGAVSAPS
jgi:MerR family transcriptional regulator, copper efflux regulator